MQLCYLSKTYRNLRCLIQYIDFSSDSQTFATDWHHLKATEEKVLVWRLFNF